jgi:glycosyl transferase family 25
MNSFNDIRHAFYINLDSRPDRKEYIEKHLETIGLKAERFKAIKLTNGALGCSMSHLRLIETAKLNDWDHILIIEDDIHFLDPKLFISQINIFLENHKEFDVLLLAGNNMPPFTKVDDSCVRVTRCQTTTGYIVRKHYYDTLINNFKEGIQKLIKHPENHKFFAIDKYWFSLQAKDKWYLIIPLTVTQREDYSDIEKKNTNYTQVMTDLDKEKMFREQIKYLTNQQMKTMQTINLNHMQLT